MIVQRIGIQYSPQDLLRFQESTFVSWMDRASEVNPKNYRKLIKKDSEITEKLFEEGRIKEKILLKPFRVHPEGIDIQGSKKFDMKYFDVNLRRTREAMMQGKKYIIQAYLKKNNFFGVADLLERVDGIPSLLGNYIYIVKDAKMAQSPRASFITQICAYCDMIEDVQKIRPPHAAILLGNNQEVTFNVNDYFEYYLQLKQNFIQFHNGFNITRPPQPSLKDNLAEWELAAIELLNQKDDISLLPDIEKPDVKILKQKGIITRQQLKDATTKPEELAQETWDRLKTQLALAHEKNVPWRLIPQIDGDYKGLNYLPVPSLEHVYCELKTALKIDGDEYLTLYNFHYYNKMSQCWVSESIECTNPLWEKGYLARFLKSIHEKLGTQGSLIFFGDKSSESLLTKSAEHSSYSSFVEGLFFQGRLIDLQTLIKKSLVLNVDYYYLEDILNLFKISDASEDFLSALFILKNHTSKKNKEWATEMLKKDSESRLKNLKNLHEELFKIVESHNIGLIKYKIRNDLFNEDNLELGFNLTTDKDVDAATEDKVELLIKQLLYFNKNEAKPKLIETEKLLNQELFQWKKHPRCISTLKKVKIIDEAKRSILYEFALDEETKLKANDSIIFHKTNNLTAKVLEIIDPNQIVLQLTQKSFDELSTREDFLGIIEVNRMPSDRIDLFNKKYRDLFDKDKPYLGLPKALFEFLSKSFPDIKGINPGSDFYSTEDNLIEKISSIAGNLNQSFLVIQGPPGAGKTFTSAHVIDNLIKQGKRIAISSNSHKAINNLIIKVKEIFPERSIFKIQKDLDEELISKQIKIGSNDEIEEIRDCEIVAGTIFGLMKNVGNFDYIFIDEAGQVGLSSLLGFAQIADNLVLIGDQMQLEQPIQATHPGESGESCLEYYLGNSNTIPKNKGFFLPETRRMCPELCNPISKLFYNSELQAHPQTYEQRIVILEDSSLLKKINGVELIEVLHYDNTQSSTEEVTKICELVNYLLSQRIHQNGRERNITINDIIIVSPYNMQVNKIKKELPNAKVGSVDLFQGQEAAIVIYSLGASSPGSRGIDFLLDEHRMNVALSRGQTLALIIASPTLFSSSVSKMNDLKLLNNLLKLRKM